MAHKSEDELDSARLWWLSLARLGGVLLAAIGVWLTASQAAGPDASRIIGFVLMVVAVWSVLFLPKWLLRRWREEP
ncbi:MAG: hypothetical protein WCZ66_02240 [Sphingomonadaceae bacterium]